LPLFVFVTVYRPAPIEPLPPLAVGVAGGVVGVGVALPLQLPSFTHQLSFAGL
jgi:hypothetical protein